MAMKKKQIITLALLGVGALVLIGVAIGLGRSVIKYRESDRAYRRYRSKLSALYKSDVFPSKDNMAIERENREQLEGWFESLITQLAKDNVSRDDRSPSQFRGRLERAIRALRQQAERVRVRLPESVADFAFGFELYAGTGRLPNPDDVPRLTEQLIIITRLNKLLFESEVSAIRSMQRDVFEASADLGTEEDAAPIRGRGRPTPRRSDKNAEKSMRKNPGVIEAGDMYSTYRFVLNFDAREEAFAQLLNKLAADPMFTLVRSVKVHKDVPEMVVVPTAVEPGSSDSPSSAARGTRTSGQNTDVSFLFGGSAGGAATSSEAVPSGTPQKELGPSHPVSGIEMEIPLQVRMEIDVYKFRRSDEAGD